VSTLRAVQPIDFEPEIQGSDVQCSLCHVELRLGSAHTSSPCASVSERVFPAVVSQVVEVFLSIRMATKHLNLTCFKPL
jgi:hypothetical protein